MSYIYAKMAHSRTWIFLVNSTPLIDKYERKVAYHQLTFKMLAERAKHKAAVCRDRAKKLAQQGGENSAASKLVCIDVSLNEHFHVTPLPFHEKGVYMFMLTRVISATFSDFVDRVSVEKILLEPGDKGDIDACLNLIACDKYYPAAHVSF